MSTMLLILLNEEGAPLPDNWRRVIATNVGTGNIVVGTASIEQDGTEFAIASDTVSGRTLAPGDAGAIVVSCDPPTETGAITATLRIPSSDPEGTIEVALDANGIPAPAPGIAVDPPSWVAGDAYVTGDTSTQLVTVTSTGTGDLTVGTITISGAGFSKSADGATGQVIPPGESRTLLLTFDPASTGAKTGTLTIPSDAGASVVVALTGMGVADPPEPPPDPEPYEVSRFYLGRQAAPISLPTTYDDGWFRVTTDVPHAMTVVKGGPAVAYAPNVNAKSGERSLHATWIGPPMAAQTVTTTFVCYLPEAYRATYLGAYVTSALRFLIWRAATPTAMSFQSILSHSSPVEPWRTTDEALPRRFPAGTDLSWSVTLTFAEGDRLVVQAGCRVATGGPGAEAVTRVRYGGASTDLDVSTAASAQPNRASWISFSVPLLVMP